MAGGLHTFGSWLGAQSMLRRSPNEGSVLAGHLQMKSRQRLLSPEDRSQQQELVFPAVSLEFRDSTLA